jgi:L-ascorbate metabolism protein UlaG (beta-lactamase superfamily)
MELQFYGANCVRLTTKKASVIIDDTNSSASKKGDIVLFTGAHTTPKAEVKLVIDQPGEYEVSDISIQGIAARGHIDESNTKSITMFKVIGEDIRVAILGHIYAELSDDQLEALGTIDVLLVPVGGNGYTLDGVEALKLIKKIEPKIVIPTHYAGKDISYEVPQAALEEVLKDLAMEPKETVAKLKLKDADLPIDTQLIVLERQ